MKCKNKTDFINFLRMTERSSKRRERVFYLLQTFARFSNEIGVDAPQRGQVAPVTLSRLVWRVRAKHARSIIVHNFLSKPSGGEKMTKAECITKHCYKISNTVFQ